MRLKKFPRYVVCHHSISMKLSKVKSPRMEENVDGCSCLCNHGDNKMWHSCFGAAYFGIFHVFNILLTFFPFSPHFFPFMCVSIRVLGERKCLCWPLAYWKWTMSLYEFSPFSMQCNREENSYGDMIHHQYIKR